MSIPAEFVDLPESDFPFSIEFLDSESGRVVWGKRVEGPGALLVPGRRETNEGRPVRVRVTYPDGEVQEYE